MADVELHDDGRREGDLGCADLAGDHGHHRDAKSVSEKLPAAHGDDASSLSDAILLVFRGGLLEFVRSPFTLHTAATSQGPWYV